MSFPYSPHAPDASPPLSAPAHVSHAEIGSNGGNSQAMNKNISALARGRARPRRDRSSDHASLEDPEMMAFCLLPWCSTPLRHGSSDGFALALLEAKPGKGTVLASELIRCARVETTACSTEVLRRSEKAFRRNLRIRGG